MTLSASNPDTTEELSPVRQARREAIVDAAEALFMRAGFRGATMEALAQDADLSKATLYGYFKDKEAAFGAVVTRFFNRFAAGIDKELNGRGSAEERLTRAILTKHRILHEYIGQSPHMQELMSARHEIAEMVEAMDGQIIMRFQTALEKEGVLPGKAADTARVLFRAAAGISEHVANSAEFERDINLLVPALLSGVRPS